MKYVIDCYTHILKIRTGGKNNHDLLYDQNLNSLGIVHACLGHHSCTVIFLSSGLKLWLKHRDGTEEIASTFYFLGNVCAKNGWVASALRCYNYNESLRIHRKPGADHPCTAKLLYNLGILHVENKVKMRPEYISNRHWRSKTFDPEPLSIVVTLVRIGGVCRNAECSRSLSCYLKVWKSQKKYLGPDRVEVGRTLLKVGGVKNWLDPLTWIWWRFIDRFAYSTITYLLK